jgi:hypothetical protein
VSASRFLTEALIAVNLLFVAYALVVRADAPWTIISLIAVLALLWGESVRRTERALASRDAMYQRIMADFRQDVADYMQMRVSRLRPDEHGKVALTEVQRVLR